MGNGYIVPSPGEARGRGGPGQRRLRASDAPKPAAGVAEPGPCAGATPVLCQGSGGSAALWGLLVEKLPRDGRSLAGSCGTVPPGGPDGDGWGMTDGWNGAGSGTDASVR